MNNKNTKLVLLLIIFIYIFYFYFVKKNIIYKEPFITKIQQFIRPHHRNMSAIISDNYNTLISGVKRSLRKTGLL
jgi:hypothetical protein